MSVYFLTNSPHGLRDKMFDVDSERHKTLRAPNNIYWGELKLAFERFGVASHTFDFWNKNIARSDDVLFVMNHPGETFLWRVMYYFKFFKERGGHILARRRFLNENYRYFSKRILIQIEPWVAQPYVYKNLEEIRVSGVYTKIFIHSRGYGDAYGFFDYFQYWNRSIISSVFDEPKNKFLTLINGNVTPHAFSSIIQGRRFREFYGERLKAIRYFSVVPGFDLYGWRWDKMPRHPFYFYYGKYTRRAWKGAPEDKTKILGQYKFAICFENCEVPGWISEKIYDCFAAGCIPVYLGAPDIYSYVPAECFIDFRKFSVRSGATFNRKSYEGLHKFLVSLSDERLQEYRIAIKKFLASRTKEGKSADDFVKEVLV
jgi:alpha(1,3/1,4) fucosyltransferase